MNTTQPTNEKAIATVRKNSTEEIRVKLATHQSGRRYVAIRRWFKGRNGEMIPSRDGFAVEVAKLPALAEAINQALAVAIGERGDNAG